MNKYIEERVKEVTAYMLTSGATIRKTARVFGVSKTTVYLDATIRVAKLKPQLAEEVRKIIQLNKAQRNARGGAATSLKYKGLKA